MFIEVQEMGADTTTWIVPKQIVRFQMAPNPFMDNQIGLMLWLGDVKSPMWLDTTVEAFRHLLLEDM